MTDNLADAAAAHADRDRPVGVRQKRGPGPPCSVCVWLVSQDTYTADDLEAAIWPRGTANRADVWRFLRDEHGLTASIWSFNHHLRGDCRGA